MKSRKRRVTRALLLHVLAEIEVLFYLPNDRQFWRRNELRAMGVEFGEEIRIGRDFRIYPPGNGNVKLGERFHVGDNVRLVDWCRIEIGDDFSGSYNVFISTGSHLPSTLEPASKPIKIGDRVFVGIGAIILAGVTIGDDVIIGAGSVVTRDIPSNSVAVGVPARVIKKLDRSNIPAIWTWSTSGPTPGWRKLHEGVEGK